MLSYQHAYHAGNAADLHKHALLAWSLDYLTRKDKPLSYLETHAGRGLYLLDSTESRKTGEARAGILRAEAQGWLPGDHPLARAVATVRAAFGPTAYPGSPLIAEYFLRSGDRADLAELHPGEFAELEGVTSQANVHQRDGFELALAICPPTPRRGMLLIDPSYEIKDDYDTVPRRIGQLARKWNVGIIALWYPILTDDRHAPMVAGLRRAHQGALSSEIRFPPARPGHGMVGSGMFIINPPYGLADEARRIEALFPTR